MSRSTLFFIFLLSLMAVLLGYNYFVQPFRDIFQLEPKIVTDSTIPAPDPTVQLLAKMSTREKIFQLIALPYTVSASSSATPAMEEWLITNQPGFVTLFGDKISSQSASAAREVVDRSAKSIPIWLGVDHEGGRVQRLNGEGFTRLPSWQALCQLEPEKRQIILEKTAGELVMSGIDLVYAPMVDLASNSATLDDRVCSHDPAVVVAASQQWITIFNDRNIEAVVKHFPGIGQTKKDLHLSFDTVTVDENDALVYRDLLTVFPNLGVMIAHVGVLNQRATVPCSLSEDCVGELRSNFPETLIFSDALDMKAAAYSSSGKAKSWSQVSQEALLAGNDVLLYGKGVKPAEIDQIVSDLETMATQSASLLERINASAAKVVTRKLYEQTQ